LLGDAFPTDLAEVLDRSHEARERVS
jgi:hypothetical protein